MTSYTHADCTICGKHHYCMPLHGDKGGPLCCLLCAGTWNAEHGRKRRLGRIVVRALAAFFAGGGQRRDVHKLELSAIGLEFGVSDMVDPLGCLSSSDTADADIELTSELLKDVLRLTHPDHHPLERQPLAQNVTQQLLKLQPFVFQAVKPEPKAERSREPADVTDKKNAHGRMINSRKRLPVQGLHERGAALLLHRLSGRVGQAPTDRVGEGSRQAESMVRAACGGTQTRTTADDLRDLSKKVQGKTDGRSLLLQRMSAERASVRSTNKAT
jgi:hypothetical protein